MMQIENVSSIFFPDISRDFPHRIRLLNELNKMEKLIFLP